MRYLLAMHTECRGGGRDCVRAALDQRVQGRLPAERGRRRSGVALSGPTLRGPRDRPELLRPGLTGVGEVAGGSLSTRARQGGPAAHAGAVH